MALTEAQRTIIARAKRDPEFRVALLKEALRLAVASDQELLEKAVKRLDSKKKRKRS